MPSPSLSHSPKKNQDTESQINVGVSGMGANQSYIQSNRSTQNRDGKQKFINYFEKKKMHEEQKNIIDF